MKFFNVVLPVLALFTAVSAVPTAVHEDTVAKRQSVDVLTLITDLTNTVKTYTSQINATTATVTSASSDAEKQAAGTQIQGYFSSINSAISDTTTQVPSAAASSSPGNIAQAIALLLVELEATLDNVIAALGLGTTIPLLGGLVPLLNALLGAVEVIVADVLALVRQLLFDLALILVQLGLYL